MSLEMKKLAEFFRLTRAEKIIFFRALYLLLFYRISLFTLPVKKVYLSAGRSSRLPGKKTVDVSPVQIVRMVHAAARLVPFSTCLSKALAGRVLMARYGYPSRLHIGVSRDKERKLSAHAWLTFGDEIVIGNGPDITGYMEFDLDGLDVLPGCD